MRRTRFDEAECPIARVADLFGDWWTPLVLRDAMYGIARFEDFQQELGVSRAVLTQRLRRLVDEGLLEKVPYQQRPPRHEYVLTAKGRAAWGVLAAMWRFGEDHMWEGDDEPPMELAFRDSEELVRPVVVDEATNRPLDLDQIKVRHRRPAAGIRE